MNTKIIPKLSYDGLLFPVDLINVTADLVEGKWLPRIDKEKIAEAVIRDLPFQNEKLTGNQIKFIRTYFKMSYREFAANVVRESHSAVASWEKSVDQSSKMEMNTEILVRLYILEKLLPEYHFLECYRQIRKIEFTEVNPGPPILMAA